MGKVLLPYRRNEACLQHEARCTSCGKLVAYVRDEARYRYPDQVKVPLFAAHNCPCTCSTDPHNCPIGQALVAAIHERKGTSNVRNA